MAKPRAGERAAKPEAVAGPAPAPAESKAPILAQQLAGNRGRCPHCHTYPVKFRTANYEMAGMAPGSVELWRLLLCAGPEGGELCHAVMGVALVNVSNPHGPGAGAAQPPPGRG